MVVMVVVVVVMVMVVVVVVVVVVGTSSDNRGKLLVEAPVLRAGGCLEELKVR
jgi:hypothetical protein